jgi:amidase/aspartyl-tRNA(Asn)/glutamyl-tRNA(Gln) amidotransferase subunit A
MIDDLQSTRERVQSGVSSATEELESCIAIAQSAACEHAFVRTMFDSARRSAANTLAQQGPLAGLSVSVKDLFDVSGQTTAAGSLVLADAPPATQDSVAVARLRGAGASLLGRTQMVEFAFSGVGTNPHYGTPVAWDGRYGAPVGSASATRIPGGSSSGAAVSVATGAAFIGLGSDTGGSIRIPAALNGIVGFKSTARLVPTTGSVPLSTTLDTVCALTRTVRDAVLAHEILAARRVTRSPAPLSAYRFAVPQTSLIDGMDAAVATAFDRTLTALRQAGAQVEAVELKALGELGAMQAKGGFSAIESYTWHRTLLQHHADRYDPRVRSRIAHAAPMLACDYLELLRLRGDWISRVEHDLQGFDAALSPTVPITAPLLADVAPGPERDAEFFRVNGQLLRNTSVVNMLDGCAISIPCHQRGELPVGLMLWHGALRDDSVLNSALLAEVLLSNV